MVIATAEPFDNGWVAEIEAHTRRSGARWCWPTRRTSHATRPSSSRWPSRCARRRRPARTSAAASFEQLVELGKTNKQLDANDQGVVQVVDWLWQYAFDQRASDIHLEPRRDMGVIRFRIDGVLHTVYQVPMGVMNAMTARIKLLGPHGRGREAPPARRPHQDQAPDAVDRLGAEVEMRLSTLPTAFGEKMVMRIFDPDTAVKDLEALGFSARTTRSAGRS